MSRNIGFDWRTTGIGSFERGNFWKKPSPIFSLLPGEVPDVAARKAAENITVLDIDATDILANWSFLPEEIHGVGVYWVEALIWKPLFSDEPTKIL